MKTNATMQRKYTVGRLSKTFLTNCVAQLMKKPQSILSAMWNTNNNCGTPSTRFGYSEIDELWQQQVIQLELEVVSLYVPRLEMLD